MDGPVTWPVLMFVAGLIAGTVIWTYVFWSLINARIERKIREALERRP